MSHWKNRIDKPGWYWCWHDHDWGYNEPFSEKMRQPKLYRFLKVEKDYAVGLNNIISKDSTFSIFFEKTSWFFGPIKIPRPPLPTQEHIENLQKEANKKHVSTADYCYSKLLGVSPENERKAAQDQLELTLKRIEKYYK